MYSISFIASPFSLTYGSVVLVDTGSLALRVSNVNTFKLRIGAVFVLPNKISPACIHANIRHTRVE